jgi:hypothetical protein
MCFYKTKQSKVLIAKRDIRVYKIGVYADEGIFKPFYYQEFEYPVNQIVFTEVKFTDTINWGFHSYINCKLVPFYNNVNLYSCGKLIIWVSLLTVYLGEFIIPEGYEIDKENSTFECIKFKPIKKYLTYKEIAEKLNKDTCFFIAKGKIQSYAQYASYDNPGVANSYRQIEKILAINQLMNIAKYYNGDWKPDWNNKYELKYCISFTTITNSYNITSRAQTYLNAIHFKNQEDAQAVIDNPNFRDILDTIYKN